MHVFLLVLVLVLVLVFVFVFVGMGSLMEELIAHKPHEGPSYQADNARVYAMLTKALGATQHMASITRFQRTRDGRKAYHALVQHNMGSNKFEQMVNLAEDVLNKRIYNGRNTRVTLKSHIERHCCAYNDLRHATDYISYEPPNEETRVRLLLNSITASELAPAKAVIMADPTKKGNFEETADYLLIVNPVPKHYERSHKISAIKGNMMASKEIQEGVHLRLKIDSIARMSGQNSRMTNAKL